MSRIRCQQGDVKTWEATFVMELIKKIFIRLSQSIVQLSPQNVFLEKK